MARLQTIFHAVNSGLVLQDQQYRILECNSAAEKILGLTREQLLGLSSVDPRWRAVHEDGSPFPGETHPAVVTLQTGQALRDIRMGLHRPGHGLTWISINTEPVRAPDGQVTMVVVSFEDITERLRVEERLLETQKLESLGLLAGGIAHDFNNILTGIMGNASLAEVELLRGGTVGQYLAEVTRSAQRASELCQQMLAYSGRGHFILHRLDLSWLVSDTSNLIAASISKKATLQQQLSDELPPVDVDPSQIRQVIMNLVINASEALGDQDGVITISTGCCHPQAAQRGVRVVSAEPLQAEYVYLEVADTGTGIEVGSMARIFDPFYTTKFTGRGLGLSAVLGIVRGHKGVLDVDSVHGQGTTFRLYLPTSAARAAGALSSAAVAPDWQGSGRVLLVDDEETVRDIASRLLQLFGFEVDAVCDGYEAVETFRRNPQAYRFVLLDLTMPRMSGSQAIAELRRIREDVRVVLMSGYSEQDARASFDDLGLTSFVQKPFGMSALRNAVMQATLTPGSGAPGTGTPAAAGPPAGV